MATIRVFSMADALAVTVVTTANPAAAYFVEALTWIPTDQATDRAGLATHVVAFTSTMVSPGPGRSAIGSICSCWSGTPRARRSSRT